VATSAQLTAVLERSRALGFLGPGPVQEHIERADAFLAALDGVTGTVVDLGSGGGVPGLVVAVARPDLHLVLLDAIAKRCAFLEEAVAQLELDAEILHGRAEELGRSAWRGSAAAVTARSFGPPAATAECGAPLLAPGGCLIVSEPPEDVDRWPEDGLARLGLARGQRIRRAGAAVQVLHQVAPLDDRFPRRNGIPAKRPLF